MSMNSVFDELSSYIAAPTVQIGLLIGVVIVIRVIMKRRQEDMDEEIYREPELEPLPKQDFYLDELKQYNGIDKEHILLAVNGKVFDVSKGKNFYGAGGPYNVFAGRDASRGLATFSTEESSLKDEYDDLSDLNPMQMDSLNEWDMQLKEKYIYVGKLLKPGESKTCYNYEESEDEMRPDKKQD